MTYSYQQQWMYLLAKTDSELEVIVEIISCRENLYADKRKETEKLGDMFVLNMMINEAIYL